MMSRKNQDRIKSLIEEYSKLLNSNRNNRLRSYWIEKDNSFSVNLYRADQPKKYEEIGTIPILINPVESFFSNLLNYNLKDYYTIPEIYLEKLLEQRINQFKYFMDDSPLRENIGIFLGSYYELSIFGMNSIFSENHSAMLENKTIIKNKSDLDKLVNIDFKKNGLVPVAIKFYEVISKYLEGSELRVDFPCFYRGPFGILALLMGFDNLLPNMILDPDFTRKAFKLITDYFIKYAKWAKKEFNTSTNIIPLFNDDVSCPTISPTLYEEFVYPEEKRIEKFFGRFSYWHSCGNCNELVAIINRLKIDVINVSAVGDLEIFTKEFKNKTAYEICVSPTRDVINNNYISKSIKLDYIINTCKKNGIEAYSIMASALEGTGLGNALNDIKNVFQWISIAREKVNSFINQEEKRTISNNH